MPPLIGKPRSGAKTGRRLSGGRGEECFRALTGHHLDGQLGQRSRRGVATDGALAAGDLPQQRPEVPVGRRVPSCPQLPVARDRLLDRGVRVRDDVIGVEEVGDG